MDMATKFQDQLVFHMTGKRTGESLAPIDVGALRPALLASYRDLTRLRYDFPLVLPAPSADPDYVHSLSSIVGGLLADLAPRGLEGERLRKHVLRLEREIRRMLAAGAAGSLSELWACAVERLSAGADEATGKVLAQAGESLKVDGEVVDCDPRLPSRFISQAWRQSQVRKAAEFRTLVDNLMRKLSDIRRASFARSAAGQQPEALAASIGSGHADVFDFAVMSKLVVRNAPKDELPSARRERIEWALEVLRTQPFYADPAGTGTAQDLRLRVRRLRRRRRCVSGAPVPTGRGGQGDRHRRAGGRWRIRRGRSRSVLRALRRERADGGRSRALSRLPRLHPGRAQRRTGECRFDRHAVRRTAGKGARAADRSAGRGIDRHRSFRVRRAQRASGHHGHGAGRNVRAAGHER